MSLVIQRETTEYLYVGVTGDEPSVSAEIAIMNAGDRPTTQDWEEAIVVNDAHDLWADAQGAGLSGDYYVALLVGPFNNTVDPGQGDYVVWLRLTDVEERPVRITPVALEII